MNIATVASDTIWKDVSQNIEHTEQHVAAVIDLYPKMEIILFPELSLTGFVVDESNAEIAEGLDSPSVSAVKSIAQKYGVTLICGIIETNPNGKPYNTQFVISKDGELLAAYRKNHLFTQSAEPEVFTAGKELVTFEMEGWKCGLATCFDIRFPRLFEAYRQADVECVFAGFNWVEGRNKPQIFDQAVKTRAHENQYFFAAVDRTGSDPNTRYYGTSVVASPYGEELADKQGVYAYAEITKDDIQTLGEKMPLKGSFKANYVVTNS